MVFTWLCDVFTCCSTETADVHRTSPGGLSTVQDGKAEISALPQAVQQTLSGPFGLQLQGIESTDSRSLNVTFSAGSPESLITLRTRVTKKSQTIIGIIESVLPYQFH